MAAEPTVREANKSYLTPRGRALQWITKVHKAIYEGTGGILGHTVFQRAEKGTGFFLRPLSVLLLTTTGRKSGIARTVPLPYFEYDGRILVVGSFAGGERHPDWYFNLQANPDVGVRIGRKSARARAIPLQGDERERYWTRLTNDWPRYRGYQSATSRTIPLVEIVR
jgi:deazaflavin-dependent oxidoreductase (nitroreductase family)